MPQPIRELSKRFLREPEMLTIARQDAHGPRHRAGVLRGPSIPKDGCPEPRAGLRRFRKALVFKATKRSVDEITVHWQQRGYQADGLHGDMNQTQRIE